MTEGNRIHRFLETGGIDWRRPIACFVERYGITRCPWLDIEVVLVADAAGIVPGLLRPPEFHVRRNWAAAMPPLDFFGLIGDSPDWAENLSLARAALDGALGAAVADNSANTRGWRWSEGRAEARLIAWPPDLQYPSPNRMHERDPRTKTACHLTLTTGFRPVCTEAELTQLETFEDLDGLPKPAFVDRLASGRFSQYELEYLRELPPGFDLHGRIGRAGNALIFALGQLHWVPLAELRAVRLNRCRPARGPGYSRAELVCASAAASGAKKALTLGDHARNSGLDEWALRLAEILDLPVEVEEFDDD